MERQEQQDKKEEQKLSPLTQNPTYGERVHDFVFNKFINFWVNLTVSAAFTYWVTHSQKPFKLPWFDRKNVTFLMKEMPPPSELQRRIAASIYNFSPMNVFGKNEGFDTSNPPDTRRGKAATNAANTFTLVTAGHPIMIGSVWLGAKIKAPFVQWLNRRHYGDEAMDDPLMKARQAAIEIEERPTLIGAIIGRLGTIVATQVTTYTVGNPTNILSWLGAKVGIKFPGMDKIAGVFGDNLGRTFEELAPDRAEKIDAYLAKNNKYNWSTQQIQADASLKGTPYKNSAQHFGKYLAQDVLYTMVTATTINPAINFLKKFIPGLTYTPKGADAIIAAAANDDIPAEMISPKALHIKPNRFADEAPDMPESTITGERSHESRIANDNLTLGATA